MFLKQKKLVELHYWKKKFHSIFRACIFMGWNFNMVLYLSCEYFNSKCSTQNVSFYFALQIHLHKFSGPNSTEKFKIKNQETARISDFPPCCSPGGSHDTSYSRISLAHTEVKNSNIHTWFDRLLFY